MCVVQLQSETVAGTITAFKMKPRLACIRLLAENESVQISFDVILRHRTKISNMQYIFRGINFCEENYALAIHRLVAICPPYFVLRCPCSWSLACVHTEKKCACPLPVLLRGELKSLYAPVWKPLEGHLRRDVYPRIWDLRNSIFEQHDAFMDSFRLLKVRF